ncbi:UNVERIFIED_CONTAM: hypothetical protein GTU68_052017, partial [Idotea baltica]|nr:hypothetical protein [Idotea baltica]
DRDGNCCYSFWCAGGISEEDPWNPKDNRPHAIMVFFRDCVAALLNLSSVKVIVILLFVVYLGGAIFGCLRVEEGLERRRLSRYDSYSVDFYDMEDKYFREYPYRVQVMITGDLNYGDPETRRQLLDLHKQFENQTYVAGSLYTESWIRGWYEFVDNNAEYLNINSSDEENFVFNLRDIYLSGEDNVYKLDVKFNYNLTRIVASRFIIQTYRIHNSNEDKDMMEGLRRIARESPLNVTVYHPLFIFFDQFVLVRSTSIKTICIAAAIMIVVSLIFIPNPWCSLWVGFSIISIEIGVVGYMTLWGVNLDSISMINLIMCIGFSVDFSAHISYAYLTAKVDTPAERVKDCLFNLGFPIIQGAISTIIGVVVLVFAPSYIFVTFFKTVFLVIFFGAMHGIFLLPVLLSLLGPGSSKTSHPSIQAPESMVSLPPAAPKPTLAVTSLEGMVNFQKRSLDDVDSLDKDMGLGTSGESSSNSSLSEATGAASAEVIVEKTKSERPATLPALVAYNNNGYVADEVNDVTSESRGAQRPPLASEGAARDRIKSSSDSQGKGRRK